MAVKEPKVNTEVVDETGNKTMSQTMSVLFAASKRSTLAIAKVAGTAATSPYAKEGALAVAKSMDALSDKLMDLSVQMKEGFAEREEGVTIKYQAAVERGKLLDAKLASL